jgi:uncharacterized protein (DUF934 family)
MSKLINKAGLADDAWQVSVEGNYTDSSGRQGITVAGDTPAAEVAAAAQALDAALIAIRIPAFADGRGFTLAHDLRHRQGFAGTLRAVGACLPDQAQELLRCGFDEIALPEGADEATWLAGAHAFSEAYAANAAERRPLFRRRAG